MRRGIYQERSLWVLKRRSGGGLESGLGLGHIPGSLVYKVGLYKRC